VNVNARRRPRRRGASLIELVVIVGSVAVVLGLCAVLIHGLLKLDRSGRAAVDDTTTLARLARRFRQDVRAAAKAAPDTPTQLVLTGGGGGTVSYHLDGSRLLREVRNGETLRGREGYHVGRLGPVSFDAADGLVRLRLARSHGAGLARPPVGVEAVLGKDRLLSNATEGRK